MSTTTRLNYVIPPSDGSRPYTNVELDYTTGKRLKNWTEDPREVQVEDARGKEHEFTLDTTGFQFYRYPAKYTRFLNDEEVEREYYPESVELIKKLTGATRVVIFDHTIRRRRPGEFNDSPQKRQPVIVVHVDQTAASAKARVHRHLPASDVESLLRGRFQIINLWRPISHPAVDWPLALCDYRSLDEKKDLIENTFIFPERVGETFNLRYSPSHRWVYKSAMDPDDLVLLKCFDSILDGSVARMSPHTGFEDPKTPEGTPFRESIELRTLVFYEED